MRRELPQASAVAPSIAASLRLAALALPPDCFAAALAPLELSGGVWERPLADFAETLRLRNDLFQEIAP
jgi:hypothetical protein